MVLIRRGARLSCVLHFLPSLHSCLCVCFEEWWSQRPPVADPYQKVLHSSAYLSRQMKTYSSITHTFKKKRKKKSINTLFFSFLHVCIFQWREGEKTHNSKTMFVMHTFCGCGVTLRVMRCSSRSESVLLCAWGLKSSFLWAFPIRRVQQINPNTAYHR